MGLNCERKVWVALNLKHRRKRIFEVTRRFLLKGNHKIWAFLITSQFVGILLVHKPVKYTVLKICLCLIVTLFNREIIIFCNLI